MNFVQVPLKRLPPRLLDCFLIDSKNADSNGKPTTRACTEPAFTICASSHLAPKKLGEPCAENIGLEGEICGDGSPNFFKPTFISKSLPKAFLIERAGTRHKGLNLRSSQQPAWTIKASITSDGRGANRNAFIDALISGQVLKLNTRALARFQSFPDWYALPESTALAGKIIGNAVPPLMAQKLLEAIGQI